MVASPSITALQDGLVGVSAAACALREYLPKVARSSATVLITGDTGTGKERVAQWLHRLSPRSAREFVAVNCSALPEGLIESELFGHERGAFTGAVHARPGHIQRADGGTLFLDEIGDMPLAAQAKLLRVLEQREVTPVGGSRPRRVDLRVVAATHQPLRELVQAGRFRADLFYRLQVACLWLPPLRERPEDIPALLAHLLAEFNGRERQHVQPPDGELMDCLLAHDWPGNVRELRNLVEAVFVDPPAGPLTLAALPPVFRELLSGYRRVPANERDRLLGALQQTHWNKTEAARLLSCSRMTLYRKLGKYHLDDGD